MLSEKAIMKTLLIGSAGNFSRFTHEPVVLIAGLQELIIRAKRKAGTENNFVLFILRVLMAICIGINNSANSRPRSTTQASKVIVRHHG
jgi:hypothetical protein